MTIDTFYTISCDGCGDEMAEKMMRHETRNQIMIQVVDNGGVAMGIPGDSTEKEYILICGNCIANSTAKDHLEDLADVG